MQVAQLIGLQPPGQHAKQQMAGQVRWGAPPECGVPAAAKLTDAEITHARNLGVECLTVRQYGTDPNARHGAQDDWRLD